MLQILVVDDDELLNRLICFTLQQAGYQVTPFSRAEDALQYLLNHQADVVLLDNQLPDLSGIDAASLLRHMNFDGEIALISASPEITPHIDWVLCKPIDWPTLLQKLQRLASIATQTHELEVSAELQQSYQRHLQNLAIQLQHHLAEQDWSTLEHSLHQLKGSAASFGYPELSQLAFELQKNWSQLDCSSKNKQAEVIIEKLTAVTDTFHVRTESTIS